MLKPLPIGIQTFRDIIQDGFLYVDKTALLYELIRWPKGVFFLSRPRRFGKSLLLSTLEEAFLGNKELFRGLWLYDSPYDWPKHPVIRVDLGLNKVKNAEELEQALSWRLNQIAGDCGKTLAGKHYSQQFENLIRQLAAEAPVVILIDEYDKPLLDNVENLEEAQRIREVLKGFYTVIKSMDTHLRFVLLTGVSKFSRVGVFSGLNNLNDISLDRRYSALLGITQAEVETAFAEHIEDFVQAEDLEPDELLAQLKAWYDGFCFSSRCQNVYNPFSLLLLFEKQEFRNYWFDTGTPTFLIKLLKEQKYDVSTLDNLVVDELSFSTYEIETLQVLPLLFQSGYLTIKDYDRETRYYTLGYPNYEVEQAFTRYLLSAFGEIPLDFSGSMLLRLVQSLQRGDLPEFFELLDAFFASVDYRLRIPQERYYQTIFYLLFKLIGLRIQTEVRTSRGRIDAVIEIADTIYIFEFKLDGSLEAALAQIRERGYAERYGKSGKQIVLVGVNFDMAERAIAGWQVAD